MKSHIWGERERGPRVWGPDKYHYFVISVFVVKCSTTELYPRLVISVFMNVDMGSEDSGSRDMSLYQGHTGGGELWGVLLNYHL